MWRCSHASDKWHLVVLKGKGRRIRTLEEEQEIVTELEQRPAQVVWRGAEIGRRLTK